MPRLTLGKRTPLSVVSPLVFGVSSLLSSLGSHFTRDSGRTLLTEVSRMSEALYTWILRTDSEENAAEAKVSIKHPHRQFCKLIDLQRILRVLLEMTVTTCAPCIRSSLCARAFETHYPRRTVASAVEPDWKEGEQAILSVLVSHRSYRM